MLPHHYYSSEDGVLSDSISLPIAVSQVGLRVERHGYRLDSLTASSGFMWFFINILPNGFNWIHFDVIDALMLNDSNSFVQS